MSDTNLPRRIRDRAQRLVIGCDRRLFHPSGSGRHVGGPLEITINHKNYLRMVYFRVSKMT